MAGDVAQGGSAGGGVAHDLGQPALAGGGDAQLATKEALDALGLRVSEVPPPTGREPDDASRASALAQLERQRASH